jgi:hypothetical protein
MPAAGCVSQVVHPRRPWSRSCIFLRARSQSTARRSPRSLALGRASYPLTTVTRPLLRRRKLLNTSLVDWFELFSELVEAAIASRTRIAEAISESSEVGEPSVPRDSSDAKKNHFTAIELTRACAQEKDRRHSSRCRTDLDLWARGPHGSAYSARAGREYYCGY